MNTNMKVGKWGSSLAVRIPKIIADQCGFQEGVAIKLEVRSNRIVISKRKYDLDDLVNRITDENCHQEVDWGSSRGKELW